MTGAILVILVATYLVGYVRGIDRGASEERACSRLRDFYPLPQPRHPYRALFASRATWEGRYTLEGPYRRPTIAQRVHRWLAWRPDPVAVFCVAVIGWGIIVAALIGSIGCGGGPRRCADTMATSRRMGEDPCRQTEER